MESKQIVRAILAFALVGAVVAMPLLGLEPPGELVGMAAAAVGFYFASDENGEKRLHSEIMDGRQRG